MSNYLDNRSVRFNLEIIIADDNCSHVNKRSWRFKDRFEFLHDSPPPLGVILEHEYLIWLILKRFKIKFNVGTMKPSQDYLDN